MLLKEMGALNIINDLEKYRSLNGNMVFNILLPEGNKNYWSREFLEILKITR